MTKEEIIKMADTSGLSFYGMGKDREKFINYLERFAKLVAEQEPIGCAECGTNGGHALYCVACAEKFVGEAATKLQQKQESIEGLNRDYDLLFAEYQLLLKKVKDNAKT
jgi:hypothetical protein